MATFRAMLVNLVWGGGITFQNGVLNGVDTSLRTSFPMYEKMNFASLNDVVGRCVGADPQAYTLKLILWYEFNGNVFRNEINDDSNLETVYFLAQMDPKYFPQFEVQFEQVIPTQQSGFMDTLNNVIQASHVVQSVYDEGGPSTTRSQSRSEHVDEDDDEDDNEDGEGNQNPVESDGETSDSFNAEGDVSADSGKELEVERLEPTNQPTEVVSRFGFLDDDEVPARNRDGIPLDEDDQPMWDCWTKEEDEIRDGMVFKSKNELIFALRCWNIKHNREMIMQDTRPNYIKAKCITEGNKYKGPTEPRPCLWGVSGSNRNKHGIWRCYNWVGEHNCFGNVRGNNNRCLTSTLIANDIATQIRKNIAYPVKHIQAHVKQQWNVDVCYQKAWNARRIAIERLFGTWQSNFAELPRYLDELIHTNPETIVRFLHGPQVSNEIATFKYIFWAFGSAIRAFQSCIPIICVDGTHLKGSYMGKLLTAVAKNANGQILPVAFAIVDQETNNSWAWFFDQFRTYVCCHSDRELCVISDRHAGILNAVNEIDGFHQRFCLRHIRSNFMARYRNQDLKKWCWITGAASQHNVYVHGVRMIKELNQDAWKYLKDADLQKWALYKDVQHRRWGNLTTNIAESLNNVLRHSRMMPIKACIEYTFNYTREHFIKQYSDAMSWTAPLSRKKWKLYQHRERRAMTYVTTLYQQEQGVYNVHSTHERRGDHGTEFTVKYLAKKCSCGRWQNDRFPCSHAIAVRGQREAGIMDLISDNFTTTRWRNQYNEMFYPLRDQSFWGNPTWSIQADPTRMITHRGRKKSKRIPNEMDDPESYTRQPPTCGVCGGGGHNRTTCPNRGG